MEARADGERPPGSSAAVRVPDLPELLAERDLDRRIGERPR
jgi:hypothetical protein